MMSLPPTSSLNESFLNSSFPPQQLVPPWIITVSESYRISFMVCYAMILVFSVLGNTSIIAIVARNQSMRSTINYLIANMAATDLAASVVVTGDYFSVLHNLSWDWRIPGVIGNMFCKLCPYIRNVSTAVSIHSIVAIAFDRFFAVVFPMRAMPRVLGIHVLLPAIWFVALGFFAVDLLKYKLVSFLEVNICYYSWPSGVDVQKAVVIYHVLFLTLFFLLPLLLVTVLYSIIALKIRQQNVPGQQTSSTENRRRKRNKNIVKLAMAIVLGFFACWSPFQIFGILRFFVWQGNIPWSLRPHFYLLSDIFILVSYISLTINPLICLVFSSNYRKGVRNLFPCSFFSVTRVEPLEETPRRNRVQQSTEMSNVNG